MELAPDEARCHSALSDVHALLGEFELAEGAARRSVQLDSRDTDSLTYMVSRC